MKPWVFKCYTRDPETRVCLLEEQTDQLSRGSTGLISWQGARCLLDWAEWSNILRFIEIDADVSYILLKTLLL